METVVRGNGRVEGEKDFQLEMLEMVIRQVAREQSRSMVPRELVLWKIRALAAQYKTARQYTYSMWLTMLHSQLSHSGTVNEVRRRLRAETQATPISNRGVNPSEHSHE